MTDTAHHVHLVGSMAFDNPDETFRTVGPLLGRRLKRVPDGEPGGRRLWISWQFPLLRASLYLKQTAQRQPTDTMALLDIADGVDPAEMRFGDLGYCHEARASYLDFLAARQRGEIPEETRFQVCLPTPFAVASAHCVPQAIPAVEAAYSKAMVREVEKLCAAIPSSDLAIQWDVCVEMVLFDGGWGPMRFASDDPLGEALSHLKPLGAAVPADVEMGIHLCYGDFDAKHFVEPVDAGKMVELANGLAADMGHKLAFVHMPVPIGRDDDAFFRPFEHLRLEPGTELYLGLVHLKDGVEGLHRRMAAAKRHVGDFGIATECGIGRSRSKEIAKELLGIHAAGTTVPA